LERVDVILATVGLDVALAVEEVSAASVAGANCGASFAGRLVLTRGLSLINDGTYLEVMINSYYYSIVEIV
jgi:hypothetical protein